MLSSYKKAHPARAGIDKSDFPALLKQLLKVAQPGQHLPAGFEKCGLYPISITRAVERIPHRLMEVDTEATRELLNSTLGEKLEELRGVGKKKAPQKRGKKVAPGKSYTQMEEDEDEEEDEVEDVDALLDGGEERVESSDDDNDQLQLARRIQLARRPRRIVESSDEEELPDPQCPEGPSTGHKDLYPVGSWVVAVYESEWYIAQVEGEEPEEEVLGFTLLKYMDRKGHNQFCWGQRADRLKTNNKDILLKVDPPIPVSSRYLGLPKDIVSKVYYHLRVKWSFICCFYLYLPLLFHFKTLLNPSNFNQKIDIGKKHERSKFRKASNKRPLFSDLIWLNLTYPTVLVPVPVYLPTLLYVNSTKILSTNICNLPTLCKICCDF